ncbi:MAG: Kef-type K+ transport system membrane component KefB/CBS domain-containing protein [Candidatus Omnitrophota bacterium]|jgi:Kef-type K+ transport system membrane component KefB/CBS domain-containing protein
MIETLNQIISTISISHLNILFVLALVLFGGTLGGRLFQKMKIPQVVGYIMIGVLLGQSGIAMIDAALIKTLQPFNYFALGLIGFMIGGELKKEVLKKYGKQFITILLFEGLVSFFFVTILVGVIGSYLLKDPTLGWALAVMLGAISSATAPAATTDVLWEYKAKGPLTTTVFGIVALDDALAIVLFAIASNLATHMLGITHQNLLWTIFHPIYEIGGAIVVGGVSGFMLILILKHYDQKERVLVSLIGMVLFVLGLSLILKVSMILAAMVLGAVVVNGAPQISRKLFNLIDNFAPPIFILFFVLIGAKVNLQILSPLLIVLIALYLFGRTSGKMLGSYLGATVSKSHPSVRKFLPLCLFSQAGVAVGLSIVASQIFPETLGNLIVIVIIASTFVVQLIGPSCVKLAITKAGEIGKNITEEDLLKSIQVDELMDTSYPLIQDNTPLKKILHIFSESPYTQYPVINKAGALSGVINIDSIKNSLLLDDSSGLLIGVDIKNHFKHQVSSHSTLYDAKVYMDKFHLGFIPVVDTQNAICGCFDRRMYQKFISTKLLQLQQV